MLRDYYTLAKPGIVYGNLITTVASFLFASGWIVLLSQLLGLVEVFAATVVGLGCVIASACVFNNYFDREIDKSMKRTQNRPLVTGVISVRSALIYGSVLGIVGFVLLAIVVNLLSAAIALFGWVMYVFVYTFVKRWSWAGALVGSIPGAVPILVGYVAVTGTIDFISLTLFLILAVWQLPHFYGIAMYRAPEYAAAHIPTIVAQKGMHTTKIHIIVSIVVFWVVSMSLLTTWYPSYTYGIVMFALGGAWTWRAVQGFRKNVDETKWARGVFLFSLIVLLGFCVVLAVAPLLP